MKKSLTILALFACIFSANAQKASDLTKAEAAMQKSLAATQNPKKSEKPATWLDYADKCMKAYSAPMGNGYLNASKSELQIVMGSVKPQSVETVTLSGREYEVEHYETADYYYQNGVLVMMIATKTVDDAALDKALDAYVSAAKVDPKGSKTKDINIGIGFVATKYSDEAMNSYTIGKLSDASKYFEKAYKASATEPYNKIDSSALYNAGFCAFDAGEYQRAIDMMNASIAIGHLEKGAVYSKIADSYMHLRDTVSAVKTLEEGFTIFPDNQSILIGLINYYIESKSDTQKLFSLLDAAKANEPNNASLYYVEGNIHKQLGEGDAAVASYEQCIQIGPEYTHGYIGLAVYYYDAAIAIADEANKEFDDAKYNALLSKYEVTMKKAIEPFEKSFELAGDAGLKRGIAEYLRNIYYRFRDSDAVYMDAYNKYNDYLKNN